jgi:hypothetical protein
MKLDAGQVPDLPFIDPALQHFVDYLFDVGPISASSGGSSVLTWADLATWERAWGLRLMPWQKQLLRRLSGEYLSESSTADEHDAPPPWVSTPDREKVAQHIRNVFRG